MKVAIIAYLSTTQLTHSFVSSLVKKLSETSAVSHNECSNDRSPLPLRPRTCSWGWNETHANASCCKRRTRFRYNTKVDICYSSVGSTSRDLSSTALYNLGTGRWLASARMLLQPIIIIIIIIIKNECHSNIIVDRLQGCRLCRHSLS